MPLPADQNSAGSAKPESRQGTMAVIAIGNPLKEEDSAAIALIQKLHRSPMNVATCLFSFDSGFAWLKEVVVRHDTVIILDSILDSTGAENGFTVIPLTASVLEHSGFVVRATHGLGWLDELKIIDISQTGALLFFGVDGPKFKAGDEGERVKFLDCALEGLNDVLEKCNTKIVPGGAAFNA